MIIHSKIKDYSLYIKDNFSFLRELSELPNSQFVIDENVYGLYSDYFTQISKDRLILIKAIEENKIVNTALDICEKMTGLPAKRNAHLVSIGGGIIQDITGFVANVLYRGIKWTFVPTTLLASCDSCIGGKTSLNYKNYKNLLGTFYPPDDIFVCPLFFNTLTDRDFKSGLGEVVKFNIMAGKDGLEKIEKNIESLLLRDPESLDVFIERSLVFKKWFIEIDEFDKGERIKLNFAHTFGHAIETITEYTIPHGTAVAIGMVMANYISVNRGYLDEEYSKRSENVLLKVIDIDVDLRDYPIEDYISAIHKDKKQTNDKMTAVLMTNTEKELKIINDLQVNELERALNYFCDLYR